MSRLKPHPTGYLIKLVRDNTHNIINPTGKPGDLWYDNIRTDFLRQLKLKLFEEVGEYVVDGELSELTDVVAVIQALAIQHDTTIEELIEDVRDDPRGGFLMGRGMYGKHSEFDRE